MEEKDEREVTVRDLMDEFTDLLVIDDDSCRRLRHGRCDPRIVEIARTTPFDHRLPRWGMQDEPSAQFRILDVSKQQTSVAPQVVAPDDTTGPRVSEHVIESGDVLEFAVFVGDRHPRGLTLKAGQFGFASSSKILPDIDQFNVLSHLPLCDQTTPDLICVHARTERENGL
ncbi:hypothetical protein [Brevibacterium linens]|uniref:hypothetical protein n=1 Tax=Brevibacterium linens TaxID=1703 RepID=UPI0035191F34